jgi:serine protease Do
VQGIKELNQETPNSQEKENKMEKRKRLSIFTVRAVSLLLASLVILPAARGEERKASNPLLKLDQLSSSVQALAASVSPSVVQVLVTRYGPAEESAGASAVVTRQENLGSGVIVDPDGYIMTNAHVVAGAKLIRVRLVLRGKQTIGSVISQSYAPSQPATLVGVFKEGDLALLKINATNLPTVPFANYRKLQQGQVVFAFGSPEGLQNSMSMGIVSSVARQLNPDSPFLYIQTDASINPGDSGGPLVNTSGEIVGLDTFIVSDSGGNEGIGFAIPSSMVQWAYEQLRKYSHVDRPVIGIGIQTITPMLAAALRLPRQSGVLISDVLPGSPAQSAGVKPNDILLAEDGIPLDNVATMMRVTFEYHDGKPLHLQVLRGGQRLSFDVTPIQAPHEAVQLADLADPVTSLIPKLEILAVPLNKQTATLVGGLRRSSGVIVAARVANPRGIDTGLQAGDAIYEINRTPISSISALRFAVRELKPGDPVALLIERDGEFSYLTFAME